MDEPQSAERPEPPSSRTTAPGSLDADRLVGTEDLWGPFRIVDRLGGGSQGRVYHAIDTRLGRSVALKVLARGLLGSSRARQRLEREARVASQLADPGICPVYEVGEIGEAPYISMGYVEGRTLSDEISATIRTPETSGDDLFVEFPADEDTQDGEARPGSSTCDAETITRMVGLVESVARSLHVAHEAGLIHRDVKPGNILVQQAGPPVVVDFGLALESEDAQRLTMTGEAVGTPAYMSPEQIASRYMTVDRRTDIYSLGVTLFECVTQERPFRARNREALYKMIVTRQPPDPRKLNPRISADLQTVILKALEKDRERRYATAAEFAEELRRIRFNEPILTRPPGRLVRTWLWSKRHPATAASLGLTVAILLVSTVVTTALFMSRSRALEDHRRLTDLQRARRVQQEVDLLWPATPDTVPRMEAWLVEARRLIERAQGHRDLRQALEARATSAGDSRGDLLERARRADPARVEVLERMRQDHAARVAARDTSRDLVALEARIEEVEEELRGLARPRFEDEDDAWLYTNLTDLIVILDRLPGLVRAVERRVARAEAFGAAASDTREAWRRTIEAVGDGQRHPIYQGMKLAVQQGLIPLGPDPESGLFEFAHVDSGPPARRDPETGTLVIEDDTGITLVLVPGGDFDMGTDDEAVLEKLPDQEEHLVALSPYFIGKYELTRAQWARYMGQPKPMNAVKAGDPPATPRRAMHFIDWFQAAEVARRAGLELPTEARWEYAIRGGRDDAYHWGPLYRDIKGRANLADHKLKTTRGTVKIEVIDWHDDWAYIAPVDAFPPNAWGLYGMFGNLTEWCLDFYGRYPPEMTEPSDGLNVGATTAHRVQRGGNWYMHPRHCSVSARFHVGPSQSNANYGVRLARDVRP